MVKAIDEGRGPLGRKRRVHLPEAYVQVTQKCHDGRFLLGGRQDRDMYLPMVNDLVIELGYHLVSYCIQDNHIHLLLKTPTQIKGKTLSAFIHRLNTAFGQEKTEKTGTAIV